MNQPAAGFAPHENVPFIDTQIQAFYDHPNSLIGGAPGNRGARRVLARNGMGVEIYAYDIVRECFRDNDKRLRPRTKEYFARRGASPLVLEYVSSGSVSFLDTDKHQRVRPILVKGFTPRRIENFRTVIRRLADDQVDRILGMGGQCNFVADYSHHFTIQSIARFIGVPPEDVPVFEKATVEFRLLGQVPLAPGLPRLEAAFTQVADYGKSLIARRRARREEDFVSDLIDAQEAGDKLSERELMWSMVNLLNAGHDTTRFQLGSCVRALVEAGAWETVAAHPELIPEAINESMRLYPATPRQVRVALEDLEIAGEPFQRDDVVILNLSGAGRDPDFFPDPDRFDLARQAPKYDLGFGYGAHYCLGNALAKAEMTEALTVLTQRLRDVEFTGPVEVKPTGVICGPEVVPIRFKARN
jgi:cytochrome P450